MSGQKKRALGERPGEKGEARSVPRHPSNGLIHFEQLAGGRVRATALVLEPVTWPTDEAELMVSVEALDEDSALERLHELGVGPWARSIAGEIILESIDIDKG